MLYLNEAHLKGFDKYKYKSRDTSPLSKYVMHPFWNTVVELLPMWVAPNLITFLGFLFLVSNFLIMSYYDYDYDTTNNNKRSPIPQWVWLYCGISHFLAHTLDGIDGKQARRTKTSTPVGELFDHGLDSCSTALLPLTVISMFDRSPLWGGSPHEVLIPLLACCAGFFLSHWEKYITKELYLPWVYDIMQLGVSAAYLATYFFGVEGWHFNLPGGLSCAQTLKWVLILGFIGSIPTSLWNIYLYCSASSAVNPSVGHERSPSPVGSASAKLTLYDALGPWVPFVILGVLYYLWAQYSPTDIVDKQPRIFLLSVGIVFSNICCRLIICQMSSQSCELFNMLLVVLGGAVLLALLLPAYECFILYAYSGTVLVAHIHYGSSVVLQLCDHFKIHCFTLKKSPSS